VTGHQRTTRRPLTAARRRQFIAAVRRGASVAEAARLAGAGRSTVYDARARDAGFRLAWARAAATARTGHDPLLLAQAARAAAATTTSTEEPR
jgi:transposase